jgi:hypothetical protein
MIFRRSKKPLTVEQAVADIRAAVLVIMYCAAITAGSTCDIGAVVDFTAKLVVEEPDETEADRAMAEGPWI